jgi:hypothetical protein
MGASASVQTAINNISNTIKLQLTNDASAHAESKCQIEIGSITFEKTSGCKLHFYNYCSSIAEIKLESIIKAVTDFISTLDNTQKQESASWFTATFNISTTANNLSHNFEQVIKQKCDSNAIVDEKIDIDNITIKECNAPQGQILTFDFINTGTATGRCAMKLINNVLVTGLNDITNKQSQGTSWSILLWPIIIFVTLVIIIFFIYSIMNKKLLSSKDKIELEIIKTNNYVSRLKYLINLIKDINDY